MEVITKDYDVFHSGNPTIQEFLEKFSHLARECSYNGIHVNSHKSLKCSVNFTCEDDSSDYQLAGFDVEQLPGCGCWSGITIVLRKTNEKEP